MFWADKLLEEVRGEQLINDSWTPSGIVHMGGLKGPVIHDTLFRILKEKKVNTRFIYGIDDTDPLDGLPPDLTESHSKYLGIPLFKVPAPNGNGSFAQFFGDKMRVLLHTLGIVPDEIYTTSQLYRAGKFNDAIRLVLDNAEKVRKVYSDVYKKEIADNWFPLQIVCPTCGKLGTTKVTSWDESEIGFSCEENLVRWAKGCGAKGKTSPFDGNSKLLWKIEWAAKWWTFGVTIEGAGKDHASAGGSYDIALKIIKEVFGKEPPLQFGYEFFLSGGKKMSSSKGVGMTGEELVEVLSPQVARFLMIKTPPNQAVEFTPRNTDAIPKVFDNYQQIVKTSDDDAKRLFALSQVGESEKIPQTRFATLAQWIQMPNMEAKINEEGLKQWAKYARVWVEKYAPESEKFLVQQALPDRAKKLSEKQKAFLKKVAEKLEKDWEAETFQMNLYEWAKELELSSKDAFAAIYIYLIGKDHGPKAAWLILSLDKAFVQNRFQEASI